MSRVRSNKGKREGKGKGMLGIVRVRVSRLR